MRDTFKYIIENVKTSDIEYKYNFISKKLEPYMVQFDIDSEYRFVIRKDIGYFSHNLDNHWHLEVWSKNGRKIYSLYLFIDEDNRVIDTKIYPKKVLKKK